MAGGLLIWLVLALALGDIDPVSERGEWLGGSRRSRAVGGDRSFTRLWCPPCKLVEEHVTDNRYVSTLVGIAQLIVFMTVVSLGWQAASRVYGRAGRSRSASVDEERIRRSVELSRRRAARRRSP